MGLIFLRWEKEDGKAAGVVVPQPPPSSTSTLGGSKETVANINIYQQFAGSLIADKAMDRRIVKAVTEQFPGLSGQDLL